MTTNDDDDEHFAKLYYMALATQNTVLVGR